VERLTAENLGSLGSALLSRRVTASSSATAPVLHYQKECPVLRGVVARARGVHSRRAEVLHIASYACCISSSLPPFSPVLPPLRKPLSEIP